MTKTEQNHSPAVSKEKAVVLPKEVTLPTANSFIHESADSLTGQKGCGEDIGGIPCGEFIENGKTNENGYELGKHYYCDKCQAKADTTTSELEKGCGLQESVGSPVCQKDDLCDECEIRLEYFNKGKAQALKDVLKIIDEILMKREKEAIEEMIGKNNLTNKERERLIGTSNILRNELRAKISEMMK